MVLQQWQLQQWQDDGYLVIPGILNDPAAHIDDLAQPPPEAATAAGLNRHAVNPGLLGSGWPPLAS
jgi:hypothetical protein